MASSCPGTPRPTTEAIVVVYSIVSPGVRAMVDTVSKRQRRRTPTAGPETDAVDIASRKCLRDRLLVRLHDLLGKGIGCR